MADIRDSAEKRELYKEASTSYDWRGSYLGFTYGGVHSSELGIVRTASSNRYDDGLLPTAQLKTATLRGMDGQYYFGGDYTQRQFSVNFSFDHLTDAQLRKLRAALGGKEIRDLIFDEAPYKVYSAAVTGNATVKHICFDDPYYGRVFKGEGTIQFTCYFPFARSRFKWLEDYNLSNIPEWGNDDTFININEWRGTSGIVSQSSGYDSFSWSTNKYIATLYNPGDIDTDWIIKIPGTSGSPYTITNFTIAMGSEQLVINTGFNLQSGDQGIYINSKTHLIQGYNSSGEVQKTHIYNDAISAGDFFKIPVQNSTYTLSITPGAQFSSAPTIEYGYLYY